MHKAEEPVDEVYIRRAFERLRHPDWGPLLVALDHPIRGNLIRGLARSLQRAHLHPPPEEPAKQPLKSPTARPLPEPHQVPLDRKRLASGEKDDGY